MIFSSLIEAFLLGLIGGATPGPILTGTFAEILNSNFKSGMRIILYALLTETIGALTAIYIIYEVGLSKIAIQIISLGGAMVLFWLATKIWKIEKINSESKQILTFNKIVVLTVLNSGYWIFWVAVGIPKALILDNVLLGGKLIFLSVFEFAWLITTIFLAFLFYKFRPILEKKDLVSDTFKVLAVVLIILGTKTFLNVF